MEKITLDLFEDGEEDPRSTEVVYQSLDATKTKLLVWKLIDVFRQADLLCRESVLKTGGNYKTRLREPDLCEIASSMELGLQVLENHEFDIGKLFMSAVNPDRTSNGEAVSADLRYNLPEPPVDWNEMVAQALVRYPPSEISNG